jgi:hypothetical protein
MTDDVAWAKWRVDELEVEVHDEADCPQDLVRVEVLPWGLDSVVFAVYLRGELLLRSSATARGRATALVAELRRRGFTVVGFLP